MTLNVISLNGKRTKIPPDVVMHLRKHLSEYLRVNFPMMVCRKCFIFTSLHLGGIQDLLSDASTLWSWKKNVSFNVPFGTEPKLRLYSFNKLI